MSQHLIVRIENGLGEGVVVKFYCSRPQAVPLSLTQVVIAHYPSGQVMEKYRLERPTARSMSEYLPRHGLCWCIQWDFPDGPQAWSACTMGHSKRNRQRGQLHHVSDFDQSTIARQLLAPERDIRISLQKSAVSDITLHSDHSENVRVMGRAWHNLTYGQGKSWSEKAVRWRRWAIGWVG